MCSCEKGFHGFYSFGGMNSHYCKLNFMSLLINLAIGSINFIENMNQVHCVLDKKFEFSTNFIKICEQFHVLVLILQHQFHELYNFTS